MRKMEEKLLQLERANRSLREDISRRERAGAALKLSEERLRLAVQASRVGLWDWDLVTNRVFYSHEWKRQIGFEDEEISDDFAEWQRRVHPGDLERVLQAVRGFLANPGPDYHIEFRFRHKDGSYRWIFTRAELMCDEHGKPVRMLGSHVDITERKRAEEALRENEQRLQRILDTMFVFVGLLNTEGRMIDVNRAPLDAARIKREDVLGLLISDTYWFSHSPRMQAQVRKALLRAAAGETVREDFEICVADGGVITVDTTFSPLRDASGQVVEIVGSAVDITERRQAESARQKLEAQLLQAQKMDALGTLAGGIAHDFNNILGAIIGNCELAQQDVGSDHRAQVSLNEIHKAGARGSDLVQQILAFSRQQPQERRIIQLSEVATEAVRLLRSTLPAGVDLVTSFAPDTPDVWADRTQIHQVLMNLCTNAWHALTGPTGRIEVLLAGVDGGNQEIAAGLRPGRFARLTVSDNGAGMDAATIERIFDPFFTTKAPGAGTGLGLSVVDGIVKSHSGAIIVHSSPGEGTAFHLYFPAAAAAADPGASFFETQPVPQRGSGQCILYLDDEEALVSLATQLLERLGYAVRGFKHVGEALAAFRADPASFDLVITDLNMPDMSGLEVAEALLRLRPDLPVVLASGYVSDDVRARSRAIGVREVIYKPQTVMELAEVIHRLTTRPK